MKKTVIFLISFFSAIAGAFVAAILLKHKIIDAIDDYINEQIVSHPKTANKIAAIQMWFLCKRYGVPYELGRTKKK